MGTIEITNEKKTGSFVYTDGVYKITGDCKLNLVDSVFDSANGSIYREDANICYFNAYTDVSSGKARININNIDAEALVEVTSLVKDCLASIEEYYK